MSTPRIRLRAVEKRLSTTGAIPPEIMHDPRVSVSLPWVIRQFATEKMKRRRLNDHEHDRITWDASRRCWIDVATGRRSDEITAERIRAEIHDLDARWCALRNFHLALREWADEGDAENWPQLFASLWPERGYARFRRWLGHQRSVRAGPPIRPDTDWHTDVAGEARDLEELTILGWKNGLDLNDFRFTHKLS